MDVGPPRQPGVRHLGGDERARGLGREQQPEPRRARSTRPAPRRCRSCSATGSSRSAGSSSGNSAGSAAVTGCSASQPGGVRRRRAATGRRTATAAARRGRAAGRCSARPARRPPAAPGTSGSVSSHTQRTGGALARRGRSRAARRPERRGHRDGRAVVGELARLHGALAAAHEEDAVHPASLAEGSDSRARTSPPAGAARASLGAVPQAVVSSLTATDGLAELADDVTEIAKGETIGSCRTRCWRATPPRKAGRVDASEASGRVGCCTPGSRLRRLRRPSPFRGGIRKSMSPSRHPPAYSR